MINDFDDLRELEGANIDDMNTTYAKFTLSILTKRCTVECIVRPLDMPFPGQMLHSQVPYIQCHDPADKEMFEEINQHLEDRNDFSELIYNYIDQYLKTKDNDKCGIFSNPGFIEYEER